MELLTPQGLLALLQVIGIDLVLAGDNAIVIGLAAAGLPKDLRTKAILVGILAATVLRIGFALVTARLLHLVGLALAGGLLLLWVCWKMWRELRAGAEEALPDTPDAPRKTFLQAAVQIVLADVSMSLDNVLAVAGAARAHPTVLVFGLMLSIALMGVAASAMARLLRAFPLLAYLGLALITCVALGMIRDGWAEVQPIVLGALT